MKRQRINELPIIIALIYGLFGFLWILLSDITLDVLINDPLLYRDIQTYKGWIYVFITTLLIYFLVRNRMKVIKQAINKITLAYEELSATHKELMTMEEAKKHTEEKLKQMAFYDTLTGLPNRTLFGNEIHKRITGEFKQLPFALVYMDVDNFKYINDTLGHQAGDAFLKYLGKCLASEIKPPNLVARLGGDEFAILFTEPISKDLLIDKIKNLTKGIGKTWSHYNHEFFISLSIGIATYPENGADFTTLYKNADIGMYAAKKEGKDRVLFFQDTMQQNNLLNVEMAKQLQYAIKNGEFVLHYQPQFKLKTGEIFGMEALIRWLHPQKGFISPAEFIPLAEETGQIYSIERWVLKEALTYKSKLEAKGFEEIEIAINLSSKTLTSDINFQEIEDLLSSFKVDFSGITIEVTETAIIKDVDIAIKGLNSLKKRGVKIALDDFGTGYSSLNYLKNLPIDIVKLDRDFVKSIEEDGKDKIIIESILYLAKDLNYEVVAEGIETRAQLEYLKKYNCKSGQGYLLSKPLPVETIDEVLYKMIEKLIKKNH